jgi:hypothetical protein
MVGGLHSPCCAYPTEKGGWEGSIAVDEGWIRFHRKLRSHWLLPSGRRYTKLEAFVDLLLSANHKQMVINIGSEFLNNGYEKSILRL